MNQGGAHGTLSGICQSRANLKNLLLIFILFHLAFLCRFPDFPFSIGGMLKQFKKRNRFVFLRFLMMGIGKTGKPHGFVIGKTVFPIPLENGQEFGKMRQPFSVRFPAVFPK
jgi:hypothetical protein